MKQDTYTETTHSSSRIDRNTIQFGNNIVSQLPILDDTYKKQDTKSTLLLENTNESNASLWEFPSDALKKHLGNTQYAQIENEIEKKEKTTFDIATFHKTHKNIHVIVLDELPQKKIINQEKEETKKIPLLISEKINDASHIIIFSNKKTPTQIKYEIELDETQTLGTHEITIISKEHSNILLALKTTIQKNQTIYSQTNVHIEKSANVSIVHISQNEGNHIHNCATELNDQYAETKHTIIIKESNNAKATITASASHNAPKTKSNLLFKGLISNSEVICKGDVIIQQNADASEGYQHSDMILLDETARAISIPNLEIKNHNVRCSHGSSIRNIHVEELFYLQSRGYSPKQAKELILNGYITQAFAILPKELYGVCLQQWM